MAASPDAVLHLAALHTLAQTGFASTSRAASVTLSGVLSRYLQLVATSCTERAALAGRSKVAAIDVVNALEDLGVGGITELQEWTADLDKEVSFTGGKMDELAGYLRDGLNISTDIERTFVPVDSEDEDEEEGEEAEEEDEESEESDEAMDVDGEEPPRVNYRPRSPDLSWLPPLPSGQEDAIVTGSSAVVPVDAVPAPQSVAERYRRPVAYSTSQLAEAHSFTDPPKPSVPSPLPGAPSSFPSLVTTYETTVDEPSLMFRQTDGRRQAADLLRLTVGNPDKFSPADTLSQALPPPHISPIVPSHSDVLPTRLIPVNPNQSGIISSILHQIRTPYLPPTLRERLTSLRPPQAQGSDHGPMLYGDPIRGADVAALNKARGKATGDETEAWFRATWDSGPHGADRWSRGRLPSGRKVIKSGDGAQAPRESEGAKVLRLKMNEKASGAVDPRGHSPGPPSATGIKLRLGGPKTPVVGAAMGNHGSPPRPFAGNSAPPMVKTGSSSSQASHRSHHSMSPVKQEYMQID